MIGSDKNKVIVSADSEGSSALSQTMVGKNAKKRREERGKDKN